MLLTDSSNLTVPPLFTRMREIASCSRCLDTGLWFDAHGLMVDCPFRGTGHHAEPNAAAERIHRSIMILRHNQFPIGHLHFDIARTLTFYSTNDPCPREQLLERNFGWTPSRLRKFHEAIEQLRSNWYLPVASRKDKPCGYWIATDENDFKAWVKRATASPITQLSTIYRVAKANWPVYAEQLELEFWTDIKTD